MSVGDMSDWGSVRRGCVWLEKCPSGMYLVFFWCLGVVVITTAQLHSTKPELRFCAGSNPARGVSEIRDGEDL